MKSRLVINPREALLCLLSLSFISQARGSPFLSHCLQIPCWKGWGPSRLGACPSWTHRRRQSPGLVLISLHGVSAQIFFLTLELQGVEVWNLTFPKALVWAWASASRAISEEAVGTDCADAISTFLVPKTQRALCHRVFYFKMTYIFLLVWFFYKIFVVDP